MWCVWGEQEHAAFGDENIPEFGGGGVVFDDLEKHGSFVLVEPLGGCVDVVVCSGVGAADDLGKSASGFVERNVRGSCTMTVMSSL